MALEGDRSRTIFAMMVARMWKNPEFQKEFLDNPKAVIEKEGITIPPGAHIRVLQDSPGVKYVNLTPDIHLQQDTGRLLALVSKLLPIPEGTEVRLVQSTDETKYIVLPIPPSGLDVQSAPQAKLAAMAADSGVEATYHDTSQTTEAESTEVTVTETTEVQDAETSTTVVAEAELVAT